MICSFLLSKKTCMYYNCLTFLLHLTKLVELFFSTVFFLTLDLLMQSFNSFYLIWQALYVSICIHTFVFALVHSGIPQYSVLVPIHFSMYFTPLHTIIDSHALTLYELTDHIQLQMSAEKMLYLNENKTILIIVSTKYLYTLLRIITSF